MQVLPRLSPVHASRPILHFPRMSKQEMRDVICSTRTNKKSCAAGRPRRSAVFPSPERYAVFPCADAALSLGAPTVALFPRCADAAAPFPLREPRAVFPGADATLSFRCWGGACPARRQPRCGANRRANPYSSRSRVVVSGNPWKKARPRQAQPASSIFSPQW